MGKPRVRILRDGLRANGVEVIECLADVWGGIDDKSQVKGVRRWLGLLSRMVCSYPALAWRYSRLPRHDWVLLGYPAIVDIWFVRLLAWLRRTPVAMDWFLSAYDTVVLDRRLVGRNNPFAWLLWTAEALSVRLASRVFMDTRAHAERMETLFRLRAGDCGSVWVGAESAVFNAVATTSVDVQVDRGFRVLFYGQFIPLHGIQTIIEAARLLRNEPIEWLIIGRGQEAANARAMLAADPLPGVRWLDWVPYEELAGHIHGADVCLGIFGTSDKAASVIPNKVFQILAAGKPLITRDSPAMRELVRDDYSDIKLVEAGDARAVADALMAWRGRPPATDPRRAALTAGFSSIAIGRQFLDSLARERSR
jgi:glycosyltransferase involved in cell wall biosynthesis